ncbi:hypothetical protein ABTL25_20025, partial [Acinetobacter baumannii]
LWPGHGRPGRIGLLLAGSKGAYFIDATAANVAPCLHDAVMRKGRDYQFDLHYAGGDYQLLGRAGYFVRRMLDGAPPGDLPVEPP